jgi:hypothetical protein
MSEAACCSGLFDLGSGIVTIQISRIVLELARHGALVSSPQVSPSIAESSTFLPSGEPELAANREG